MCSVLDATWAIKLERVPARLASKMWHVEHSTDIVTKLNTDGRRSYPFLLDQVRLGLPGEVRNCRQPQSLIDDIRSWFVLDAEGGHVTGLNLTLKDSSWVHVHHLCSLTWH